MVGILDRISTQGCLVTHPSTGTSWNTAQGLILHLKKVEYFLYSCHQEKGYLSWIFTALIFNTFCLLLIKTKVQQNLFMVVCISFHIFLSSFTSCSKLQIIPGFLSWFAVQIHKKCWGYLKRIRLVLYSSFYSVIKNWITICDFSLQIWKVLKITITYRHYWKIYVKCPLLILFAFLDQLI